MRYFILLTLSLLLTACVGTPPRQSEVAVYDLGQGIPADGKLALPIASVEVKPSLWLDSPALLYRLNYANEYRRHTYVDSRWMAPPAELFARHLRQQLGSATAGAVCHLDLSLDELEQQFTSASQSQIVLEMRASLMARRGEVLARHAFVLRQAAATADAQGGVQATRQVLQAFVGELTQWVASIDKTQLALCQRGK